MPCSRNAIGCAARRRREIDALDVPPIILS